MTNADRQKRYRAKKRNAPLKPLVPERLLERNAQTVTESPDGVTRVTVEPECNAPDETLTGEALRVELFKPIIDDNRVGPEVYYWPRTHTERLNWGDALSMEELHGAGLVANRVPIPGDYDYVGVYQC